MTALVDILPSHAEIVRDTLRRTAPSGSQVLVFGSRATGKARRISDLDLAIDCGRYITLSEHGAMRYEFEEAPLPWSVDVVDLNGITPEFRARIAKDMVPFPVMDMATLTRG